MSTTSADPDLILEIEGVMKYFPIEKGLLKRTVGHVRAVDGISFAVPRGESFGIVGESGCGKSTLGRALLRLIEPTAGRILFRGRDGVSIDVGALDRSGLRTFRRRAQMIFQDPRSSLNSRMTIGELIKEPLIVHGLLGSDKGRTRVSELLGLVGLSERMLNRFPHEVSGGQRQRIGIARALALDPEILICDEAVSALDVSVRAQVINLLMDLQDRLSLTYLFISHDLGVVRHFCHRVAVLYLGRVVEMAPTPELFANPRHPYTKALLSAIPVAGKTERSAQILLSGEIPSPAAPPAGCRFHTRCWAARPSCMENEPELRPEHTAPDHVVACPLADEIPEWKR